MKVHIDKEDLEMEFTNLTDLRSIIDILNRHNRNFSVMYREEDYGDHLIDNWNLVIDNQKGAE